jgi:hypothetical protein
MKGIRININNDYLANILGANNGRKMQVDNNFWPSFSLYAILLNSKEKITFSSR